MSKMGARVAMNTMTGALLGAVIGYLLFTDRGRIVSRQLDSGLEEFSRDLMSFRNAVQQAARAANHGWKLLNGVLGDGGKAPALHPSGRTSPF